MSISSTLLNSGNTLRTFTRALEITQNNVANASTPGYVRQSLRLVAEPFDTVQGAMGGVRAGDIVSARNEYAEQAVRREVSADGAAQQGVENLTALESVFDISGNSGIPYALNGLYGAFSAWAQSPSDAIARNHVIETASTVADAFRETAEDLDRTCADAESALRQTVNRVNQLADRIAEYNRNSMQYGGADPGVDAQLNATLEELAEYVSFSVVKEQNGSVNVLIEGEIPLVISGQKYDVSVDYAEPQTPPPVYSGFSSARIHSAGREVTSEIAAGRLGALLEFRNETIPEYRGDSYRQGDLNVLAAQIADRVNQILTSGNVSEGPPPVSGTPLFSYDSAAPASAARTLALDAGARADTLAAIDPGPPGVSNGIPLRLSSLASPTSAADMIGGSSYQEFYGQIASRAGSALSEASNDSDVQKSVVAQARSLRDQISGVSLDEEALNVVEFQRAYQATSRLISVLDQLAEDTLNLLR